MQNDIEFQTAYFAAVDRHVIAERYVSWDSVFDELVEQFEDEGAVAQAMCAMQEA